MQVTMGDVRKAAKDMGATPNNKVKSINVSRYILNKKVKGSNSALKAFEQGWDWDLAFLIEKRVAMDRNLHKEGKQLKNTFVVWRST
jgi:hypothetical protein